MNKILLQAITVLTIIVFAASCQYKFIMEPEQKPPPDPEDTISFANDVVPIFNTDAYCTSCHTTGGTSPDLTPDNAYNSLISGGYVNTDDPEESSIYKTPHPDTDSHTWKKYKAGDPPIVLQWIEQGALDN